MRVLRVYHAGRDAAHRLRERALVAAGVEVVLAVPAHWPESGSEDVLSDEPFRVVELDVRRPGDVNRHTHASDAEVRALLDAVRPDVLDLHEEPVSLVARQWLRAAAPDLPVVLYTAQNLDKRFPPPFAAYERAALARAAALYPCSRQAASVARGKGFAGRIDVLPLGFDPSVVTPGTQSADDAELVLGLVGRMVPEKGVRDAVHVLSVVRRHRAARLLLVGTGPEVEPALALARDLGVADGVEVHPWVGAAELAALYRRMHVVLVPSTHTRTWVEQFGRVIVEGQGRGCRRLRERLDPRGRRHGRGLRPRGGRRGAGRRRGRARPAAPAGGRAGARRDPHLGRGRRGAGRALRGGARPDGAGDDGACCRRARVRVTGARRPSALGPRGCGPRPAQSLSARR